MPPAPNGRRPPCPSGTSTAQRTWIVELGFAARGRGVSSRARAPSLLDPPGASTSAAIKTGVMYEAIRTLELHRGRRLGSSPPYGSLSRLGWETRDVSPVPWSGMEPVTPMWKECE